MSLVDAHIHLTDNEFSHYTDSIMKTFKAMKIKVCSVCVDTQTSIRSIRLFNNCANRETIAQFIGIHPLYANHDEVVRFQLLFDKNVEFIDGIGEIGLDKTYALNDYSPYSKQKDVFELMLRLAESHHKPISVHSRGSLDEVLQLMSTYNINGVLIHWFSGNKGELRKCMDRGYYVSYGPALVYSKDKRVLLGKTDKSQILTETDGPNKYSHCFGNYPALPSSFLGTVVKTVGEVVTIPYEETLEMLTMNWHQYLGRRV